MTFVSLAIRDEGKMTAEQLHNNLMQCDVVEARLAPDTYQCVSVMRVGSLFVMSSPLTGRHTLAVDVTNPERLMAHWRGFVAQNRVFWRNKHSS